MPRVRHRSEAADVDHGQLALDAAGTTIDDLSTSYAANAVTMTAETTGTISTTTPITGITIVDDTITVDLTLIPRLSGIMVRGGE